jgi:flavodoxin/ferredoxin
MKILLAYFSATGNTAAVANVIANALADLGAEVTRHEVTSYEDRQKTIDLEPYQAIVFGAPVYSLRAPRVMSDWWAGLNGRAKKCATFFTYGGFQVYPAHYYAKKNLESSGFSVVASAEFLGKHAFNLGGFESMDDRPDDSDFDAAGQYARRIFKRFTCEDPDTLGALKEPKFSEEQLDKAETFRFKTVNQLPTRGDQECSMCMTCEELCPTGAMKAEIGEADKNKCIVCLRCVANCQDEVLHINDLSATWSKKLQSEGTKAEDLKSKKSRIYL